MDTETLQTIRRAESFPMLLITKGRCGIEDTGKGFKLKGTDKDLDMFKKHFVDNKNYKKIEEALTYFGWTTNRTKDGKLEGEGINALTLYMVATGAIDSIEAQIEIMKELKSIEFN